jgi:Flp pilus assembly pilin Flp
MTPSFSSAIFVARIINSKSGAKPKSITLQGAKQMKTIKNFIKDESGIETLEYAIVAAIVAAVALLIYGSGWGGSVQNTLKNAAAQSTTATL